MKHPFKEARRGRENVGLRTGRAGCFLRKGPVCERPRESVQGGESERRRSGVPHLSPPSQTQQNGLVAAAVCFPTPLASGCRGRKANPEMSATRSFLGLCFKQEGLCVSQKLYCP